MLEFIFRILHFLLTLAWTLTVVSCIGLLRSSYSSSFQRKPIAPADTSALRDVPDEVLASILSQLEWDEVFVARQVRNMC